MNMITSCLLGTSFLIGIAETKAAGTNAIIWPSTLHPKAGVDIVYITGTNLPPSEHVFFVVQEDKNGSSLFADASGNFRMDITDSPCITTETNHIKTYNFWTESGIATTNFVVIYEPEKMDAPKSVITRLDKQIDEFDPSYSYINIEATCSVGNAYTLEYTTNVSAGPWIRPFDVTRKVWTSDCTNVIFGTYLPNDGSQFFRIVSGN